MKKTWKNRLLSFFLLIVMTFALASCSSETEYTGKEAYAKDWVESFVSYMDTSTRTYGLDEVLDNYKDTELGYYTVLNFKNAIAEYGDYQSCKTKSVKETDDDVYAVRLEMIFENATCEAVMEVNVVVTSVDYSTNEEEYGISSSGGTAMTIDKVKSLGEKMGNAGLNTLMGVGVVFVMLVLISFIISLFKYISRFEAWLATSKQKKEDKKNRKTESIETATPVESAVPEVETAEQDDTELVAVIAAAIAAFEGSDPSGIVVRSIRKVSGKNNWKRG